MNLTFNRLFSQQETDPHTILGIHNGKIRIWRPDAADTYIELFGKPVKMDRVDDAGLFEIACPPNTTLYDYQIYHNDGQLANDPYAFLPTIGEVDQYLFGSGVHYQLYNVVGGRLATHQGVQGVKFSVWAPSARAVSVVGDFNFWDGRVNPMRSLGNSGVWEIFIPGLKEKVKYKFEIRTQANELKLKADPMAYASEKRPKTASVIESVDKFVWEDHIWIENRAKRMYEQKPINIYEIHAGSWKRDYGHIMNWRELAHKLGDYLSQMGYTHVELMPIQEHPLDESWGYQVSGFYAPTSRYGTPEDFQYFVNHMHNRGIAVILDWVPGHFPTDEFSLGNFDGTALYEHADPRQGFHPHWNTLIFNFGRKEVSNFLIANALYWFDKMHIDGLRVDAVASMLYLDYGRENGEWIPNMYGGIENLESIEFMKHLNATSHRMFPGTLMIAEESTAFPGITTPVENGGLGFDFKWNMGWMNDTLRYFAKDSLYRTFHHNDLTFGLLYAFSEKFVLALSHDEVVHQKGSLISKMPGDYWQKFANLRLLFSYQICQPGKKLNFMGGEIAQWNEWNLQRELEWHLLDFPIHRSMQTFVKELNFFYRMNSALWERDFDHTGFAWVDFNDTKNSVISYLRKSTTQQLLCVHNFTPETHFDYFLPLQKVAVIREAFNSDLEKYSGSGQQNSNPRIADGQAGLFIKLPPLSTLIFHVHFS